MDRQSQKTLWTLIIAVLLIAGCGRNPAPEPTSPAAPEASPEVSESEEIREALGPGRLWRRADTLAVWPHRNGHVVLVFRDHLWVIGGQGTDDEVNLRDTWTSEDALEWKQATNEAHFPARNGHAGVVFQGRMWILGGNHGKELGEQPENDIWSSVDGTVWTRAVENAPWSKRTNHAAAVFNGRMWVFGGETKEGEEKRWLSDVWSSSDGANWEKVTEAAPWKGRNNHHVVVYKDALWLTGGWGEGNLNDVWRSEDGLNWTEISAGTDWAPRNSHTSLVHDNNLWVIGGWGAGGWGPEGRAEEGNLNDVWYSEDGKAWIQSAEKPPWLPRNGHASAAFQDKIWVMGGWSYVIDGNNTSDIWYAD
jgi:hypothetical protein